ncbi:hypothetical protein [Pectinatus haikarae]|uniref:Site-specific recombinase XerD n=1 Tax=Pectinatus haikarae TaxID=349096 RepID=A0ABT9Y8E1_9FIRM|nr:hypothetical protein [Pectinatus haikarae]MDQ0204112.1 site-specific recombinase XerD [Pectinatus haikarae]
MTINILAQIWLDNIKTSVKINTYHQYDILVRNYILPRYGHQKLPTLKSIEIQSWLNNLYQYCPNGSNHLSARTINAIRNVWRTMMGFAVDNGFTGNNPLMEVKHVREEKKNHWSYQKYNYQHY